MISYRIHDNNVCGFGKNFDYKGETGYKHLHLIQHPYPPKPLYKDLPNYKFQIKRNKYIYSIKGRLLLALSIPTYIKSYKTYFLKFYLYDLFIGVFPFIKKRLKFSSINKL